MLHLKSWMMFMAVAMVGEAAEYTFDLGKFPVNQPPPGFRSAVSGQGKAGEWKILLEDLPPLLAPLTDKAPVVTKRPVLAQLSRDPTDEHFPLLIYEGETYGDFTLIARIKTVAGDKEQMAGLAFRIQDEKNYYVVRVSSLGNTFRFYKFVNGERSQPIGPEVAIARGVWQELAVDCRGNRIRCLLNGKEAIPALTDFSFSTGKIGFWTKSDAVSYFADVRIQYVPREPLAQVLVRDQLTKYPRLLGLKIYHTTNAVSSPARLIASDQPSEIGQPGGTTEHNVITRGTIYTEETRSAISVIMPLHDRNGDVVAAARVVLKSFFGQTEQNAIARALPIVKGMEARIRSGDDLMQ